MRPAARSLGWAARTSSTSSSSPPGWSSSSGHSSEAVISVILVFEKMANYKDSKSDCLNQNIFVRIKAIVKV